MKSGSASLANFSTTASTSSTSTKPNASVSGSRRPATIGGRTALSTAISAATMKAPPTAPRLTPGTRAAATYTEAAATIHETTSRRGRNRGFAGCQSTPVPYAAVVTLQHRDSSAISTPHRFFDYLRPRCAGPGFQPRTSAGDERVSRRAEREHRQLSPRLRSERCRKRQRHPGGTCRSSRGSRRSRRRARRRHHPRRRRQP